MITMVATTKPAVHATSAKISCGWPSIDTRGTAIQNEKKWKIKTLKKYALKKHAYHYNMCVLAKILSQLTRVARILLYFGCSSFDKQIFNRAYHWPMLQRTHSALIMVCYCATLSTVTIVVPHWTLIEQQTMGLFKIAIISIIVVILQFEVCFGRSKLLK